MKNHVTPWFCLPLSVLLVIPDPELIIFLLEYIWLTDDSEYFVLVAEFTVFS